MNTDKAYSLLREKSINKQKVKEGLKTTPKSDDKSIISEIDLCHNIEYGSWFIKTFWGSKKAYRYTINYTDINLWLDYIDELSMRESDFC